MATATKVYRGKCPRCCPDGGACFERWGGSEKKCNNCHLILPFRQVKATGKPTTSQQKVIDRIVRSGWALTDINMIGRKAWVQFTHPTREWCFMGNTVHGTISVGGAFDLKLQRFGGDKVIRDTVDIEVYLR